MGSINLLKRESIERLLQMEDFFMVVIDPTAPGVVLPADLMATSKPVALNIGLKMDIPVPDLSVDDAGIVCTLSFGGEPFTCELPWSGLMQVSAGEEHMVFIVPRETLEASHKPRRVESKDEKPDPEPPTPTGGGRPTLRVVR